MSPLDWYFPFRCVHLSRATVFILDDTQIIKEAFLEDVNGILNTGEVPSLFNNEEMVAINEALTKPAQVLLYLYSGATPRFQLLLLYLKKSHPRS